MRRLGTLIRATLVLLGALFLLLYALCWTSCPWHIYHWLSMPDAVLQQEPEYIVILGGGGIPSESGLMRTYYGARAALRFQEARVILALPGAVDVPGDALNLMREELMLRGVSADRIDVEPKGSNTRSQAVLVHRMLADGTASVLLVTSPEHMRRAVRSFERAGFAAVGGYSAEDTSIQGSLALDEDGIDDTLRAPAIEGNISVRYAFWNQLTYLNKSAREAAALLYYRIKGWI